MTTATTYNAHHTTPACVLSVAFAPREKTWRPVVIMGQGPTLRTRSIGARDQTHVLQAVARAKRRCGLYLALRRLYAAARSRRIHELWLRLYDREKHMARKPWNRPR